MINIIIVEDNSIKLGNIIELIQNEIDIPFNNISTAVNVKEAKILMRSTTFDLMILDLVLPLDSDDEISPENGITFLKTIQTNPTINPPIHIVGLTGFTEYKEKYSEEFSKYLWYLIEYKSQESDWKEKLKEIFFHLIKVRKDFINSINLKYDFDIAIVAALNSPELDQILKLPANWEKHSIENDASQYYIGFFINQSKKLKVVCASAPQMGMVASATLAMKMINSFRPRYIVMTGIAAGYKSDNIGYGDILIADQSYDGTSGKIATKENNEKHFSPNPTPIPLDSDLKEKFRAYENNEVFSKIKRGFNGNTPNTELKMKIGPLVSVPFVIQNESEFVSFKETQRKLIGLEMEAYGIFYSANNSPNPKPKPIVIKSICDFGDVKKGDDFQIYAAYTSAQFFYEFALNEL
jgi:nucleoside phosphorylase/CheY-like chemotaxis protein